MAKLRATRNIPGREPGKRVMSKEKQEILKKMSKAKDVAYAQAKHAEKQASYFDKKMNGTPGSQSETMFGSSIAENLFVRSQDKYHAVKWTMAHRSIRRRYHRLTNLIRRKQGKC